jgi:uncharacterized lipoprotein YddW (UPF0748 family)
MRFNEAVARARGRFLLAALALAGGCVLLPRTQSPPEPARTPPPPAGTLAAPPLHTMAKILEPPQIPREFRGVWVASVGNMDWPSRPGLSVERQQAELIRILDRAAQLGLNAVIFQVRPGADALYQSSLEPWSEYLTGTMGRAPEPFYDPLEFAVREAHRRGLELHAWFNPFRARYPGGRSAASADHISRARPDLVRRYGRQLWMDPAEPEVQDHAVRVILDVVRRYDIDGVHIDDYFYPYREYDPKGKLIPFPDDAAYERFRRGGGTLGRSDWRRENVNRFVERLYAEVKRERREVKLGISPFGIWRPGHPAQIRGLDAYEEIFADARKWLTSGWLDYFTPQLYWPIHQTAQSFPVLLDWWADQNHHRRHIWPGSYSDRVGSGSRAWPASEILAQIEATRENSEATGNVFFRMSSLLQSSDGLAERLARESYARPALVPASPWLDGTAPARPRVALRERAAGRTRLDLAPGGDAEVFLWTVRARSGTEWSTQVLPGWQREATVAGSPDQVVVTAVGRTGNEGPSANLIQ